MATIGEYLALVIAGASALGLATGFVVKTYKRHAQIDTNSKNIELLKCDIHQAGAMQDLMLQAHLAILHDRLYCLCEHYIHKEKIYTDDLNNVEHLYKAYSALGGNGTAEELYNRVKKLKIVKEIKE